LVAGIVAGKVGTTMGSRSPIADVTVLEVTPMVAVVVPTASVVAVV
jgi:hypothetical protein